MDGQSTTSTQGQPGQTSPGAVRVGITVAELVGVDGAWRVVDTEGRALRLGVAAVDPRLVTLNLGQRLSAVRAPDGTLTDATL